MRGEDHSTGGNSLGTGEIRLFDWLELSDEDDDSLRDEDERKKAFCNDLRKGEGENEMWK